MKNRVRVFVEFIVLSMNINKINKVLKDMYNMKKKRIGKASALGILIISLFTFAVSCTKDDDMGGKMPIMNHQDNNYYLYDSPEKVDSLYEIYEQPYHLWRLGIYSKETHERIGDVSFSNQNETEILDDKGKKLGEVKYGKNDVMEINIYNFCTLKRKLDSQKGKMYIITPTQNKSQDIYLSLIVYHAKGQPTTVNIY